MKDELHTLTAEAERVRADEEYALRALTSMDLTSLGENDTDDIIRDLCARAVTPRGHVAAVCVYDRFVPLARREQGGYQAQGPETVTSGLGSQASGMNGGWLLPSLATAGLSMVTVMLFFLMPSQLPFYLEGNGFDGATGTALGLGALTLSGALTALKFSAIRARMGLPGTFAAGFSVMAAGFAMLALRPGWDVILPGCALIGTGYALVQPAIFLAALDRAPAARRGTVSGMVTTSMFLGQIVSPFVFTPVLNGHGFAFVYLFAGGLLGTLSLGALVLSILRRQQSERFPAH